MADMSAGKLVGIDLGTTFSATDILDEPTAAALAYSLQTGQLAAGNIDAAFPSRQQTVLVYDLGGGTFDVTLVRLSRRRFECLGIEGDVRLGGKDWDDRIVDHVAAKFQKQHGGDPREDPQSLANLRAASERAKRTLSKLPQTSVTCTHGGHTLTVPLTRTEFETLT